MEVEEKEETAVSTEMWTDGEDGGTCEKTQTFDQSNDSNPAPEPAPGDVVAVGDRSDLNRRDDEAGSEVQRAERSNATSVIVTVLAASQERKEEDEDNQSVTMTTTTTTLGSQTAEHPGKVFVTDVTVNSLTVTFKEATMAEGFFNGY